MWHNAIGPWGWRLGNILGLGSQRSLFGSWLHSTSGAALQSPYFEAFHLPPTWELWRCWDHLSGCGWWKAPFGIGSLPPSYFLVSLCHICLLPYPNMKFTNASGEKYVLKSHLLLCVQDGGGGAGMPPCACALVWMWGPLVTVGSVLSFQPYLGSGGWTQITKLSGQAPLSTATY